VAAGFSPLDEELGLVPGALTPRLHEHLVRLGTWLPFRPAARMLAVFTGVTVSEATARRQTEGAGAAYVALQDAEAVRLAREVPEPPPGPAIQLLTVDGAMVPLLHQEWGEAKTLTIGAVAPGNDGQPHATDLSYFSRRADHATFTRLALVETQARGTETAGTVVGVCDGAAWCQDFLDHHCPEAVRVLDFPHAVEYLATAAKTAFGAETAASTTWLAAQAHELKHGDPVLVLGALEGLPVAGAPDPVAATAAQGTAAEYLGTRLGQIQYARFQAAGYPIGSGAGESGNKVVVEGRLKGAGMHWAPDHVDPMLALRTVEYSDRWEAVWPQIGPALRAHARARIRTRAPRPAPAPIAPMPPTDPVMPPPRPPVPRNAAAAVPARPKTIVNGKPTARHPWKTASCLPGGHAQRASHPEL
jgi:hypothetical protein